MDSRVESLRVSDIGEISDVHSVPVFSREHYGVGRILAGKYRVERIIGEGAMGIVLAATHLELDELVAIKFIRPEVQRVPGVVSRFAREAKALVRIKSDHVATVLDVGVTTPIGPYIVMEHLQGEDLGSLLDRHGYLPHDRAVEYVMQACEALAIAHACGIVHRDIKPENLFVTRRGEYELIKVLDFGVSKANLTGRVFGDDLSLNRTSMAVGTPLYMSPEQIRATKEVDARTDIWSLGAVLYELLTGRTAFVGSCVTQVCAMVLETQPAPLAQDGPALPPGLQLVIDRCLQKDPNQRFQTCAELAFALLPFAPSRARLHAERSQSVLIGGSNPGATLTFHPPSLPPSVQASSPAIEYVEAPTSTAPVVADGFQGALRPRYGRYLAALGLLGCGLAGAWVARTYVVNPGILEAASSQVAIAELASERQVSVPPAASVLQMQSVVVESDPVGASVMLEGRVLGVTPLRAQLPRRMLTLTLSKPTLGERSLRLDLAAPDVDPAVPVVVREKLDPEKAVKPAEKPAFNRRLPAKSPPRSTASQQTRGSSAAASAAVKEAVESPSDGEPSSTSNSPNQSSAAAPASQPMSSESKARPKLLGERPRVKLVE